MGTPLDFLHLPPNVLSFTRALTRPRPVFHSFHPLVAHTRGGVQSRILSEVCDADLGTTLGSFIN